MYGKSSHSEHFSNHCTNSLSPLVIIPISSTFNLANFEPTHYFFPKYPQRAYTYILSQSSRRVQRIKPLNLGRCMEKVPIASHFSNHCTDCLSSLVIIPISSKSRKFRTTTYIFSQSSRSVHTNIFFPKVPAECNELKLGRCMGNTFKRMESSNFEQTYTFFSQSSHSVHTYIFFPKVPAECNQFSVWELGSSRNNWELNISRIPIWL